MIFGLNKNTIQYNTIQYNIIKDSSLGVKKVVLPGK